MTEKNVLVYKLFLSLNISDFIFFFFVKLQPPPEKSYPLFSSSPLSKLKSSQAPFVENLIGSSTHPSKKAEGAHYAHCSSVSILGFEKVKVYYDSDTYICFFIENKLKYFGLLKIIRKHKYT